MNTSPPQTNKPGDHSPYASIRSPQGPATSDGAPAPAALPSPSSPGFAAELAKLQEMRDALWEAFKAGPDAGLPTILIDLTNCYTNTLRFQMNMKALHSRKPKPPLPSPEIKRQG